MTKLPEDTVAEHSALEEQIAMLRRHCVTYYKDATVEIHLSPTRLDHRSSETEIDALIRRGVASTRSK